MVPWKRRVEITALQNQTCLPWKTGIAKHGPTGAKKWANVLKKLNF